MKKTFPLTQPRLHTDRVLDAVKHEIRKYLKRERRKPLPEGADFLDFDCRFGLTQDSAETTPLPDLMRQVDAAATSGATHIYVELLSRPGRRPPRPEPAEAEGVTAGVMDADADTDGTAPVDAAAPPAPAVDETADGKTH